MYQALVTAMAFLARVQAAAYMALVTAEMVFLARVEAAAYMGNPKTQDMVCWVKISAVVA